MDDLTQQASDIDSLHGRNGDVAGASMVFIMRLLLALSALLTLTIAPADLGNPGAPGLLPWLVFSAYLVHSVTLLVAARRHRTPFWHGKVVYWLDLGWYGLMVYCSGGTNSFFFPFFFFVILTASFQWGFDEGARITLAAALVLALSTWLADQSTDQAHLLLRATFLLALGYMISYWGGMGLSQRRRLSLLRRVSQLSNPRFGVDQTIASMLQQTGRFYHASNCLLLMRSGADDLWQLHSATGDKVTLSHLSDAAAAPLLAFGPRTMVQFARALHPRLGGTVEARVRDGGDPAWRKLPPAELANLVDLLDAASFVSVPLPLRKGEGRLYVVSAGYRLTRGDAAFLRQLAAQFFPVIENIVLLDRLASDAAFRERQKIARDLHDTTIQPYIGLRHGISAIRQSMQSEHPSVPELDKLLDMTSQVITDMRTFAKTVREGAARQEHELLVALRRQARQVQEFYGLAIAVDAADGLRVSDRLAAEVFQIVNEGMSNIRKHTRARSGRIYLSTVDDQLRIRIENETPEGPPAPFLPGSIAERTAALGGTITIDRAAPGATAVNITIPV
ncbi:histidine kinase [Duganella dendranthematis]|uniref:histidine kinase n=1 Tax=Duganella dendranthematis TaxID=2728021 RepID=A0ABX6M5Q5_9BURK|nr:histidine kinase [Duganella dendranthematis]QJD89650.1 histidine kinase [Duganella dendranthematis]